MFHSPVHRKQNSYQNPFGEHDVEKKKEHNPKTPQIDAEIPLKRTNNFPVQRKAQSADDLSISQPEDASEKEADAIAKDVSFGKQVDLNTRTNNFPIQPKGEGSGMSVPQGFGQELSSAKNNGFPIGEKHRSGLEQQMQKAFGDVKIHHDTQSDQLAESISAKAFTHGKDIYFRQGQYDPGTSEGKELLAHELVHTGQQSGIVQPMIQRAEADTRLGRNLIQDSKKEVNTYVNESLKMSRSIYDKIYSGNSFVTKVIDDFFWRVASSMKGKKSPIEIWAEALPGTKQYKPTEAESKYGDKLTYGAWQVMGFKPDVVAATMLVNDIFIGSDKLGHFFQQGHEYYRMHKEGKTEGEVEKYGHDLEIGTYGLGYNDIFGSGVYSSADLEANRTGYQFYKDLEKDINLIFDIGNYINSNWNEENNLNAYHPEIAPVVWENLLRGSWRGKLDIPQTGVVDIYMTLAPMGPSTISSQTVGDKTYKTSNIVGGFYYGELLKKTTSGAFTGKVFYYENSDKAIESIWIEFEWEDDVKKKHKGIARSEGESKLTGNFGIEISDKFKVTKSES